MKIKSLIILSLLAATAITVQAQELKIGYTNVEYVLSLLPETKSVDSEYKAYEAQLQNQLKAKGEELQNKLKVYQDGAAGMTDLVRADKEAELQSLNTRFESFQRDAQTSLQKKQSELFAPLFEKISVAIKAVAKENGYTHIFSTGVPGVDILLHADEQYDVSNLIFKKLGIDPPAKSN